MELMRSRALANTIADPMERQRALIQMDENERAARRGAQAEELTGLQISRERDTVTREQKNREATQALSQQLSSGNPPDVTQIYKLASDFGVDPAPLVKLAADNLGLDEKTAKAATEKLVKQINAASTSPDKFRTLLDTVADPDPLDNIKPELRETKNGYRVFYGDRAISPEFKETKDMTALQQLAGFYRDTISGKPMETAITMATLDAKRAAIEASRGQVRASDATTNLRTQQGQVLSTQAAGNAEAQQIRARYDALSPEDQAGAVGQGLVRQFNMANVKAGATVPLGAAPRIDADREAWLRSEQKLIEADTPPEAIEAQRTAFFVRRGYAPAAARQVLEAGVNPATGKPLTRSDVDAYNKTYPQTPVDPGSLPWLPSPEREARRQGLISQIPR
jgi:hypothetical protein